MTKPKNPIYVPMWIETLMLIRRDIDLLEISKIMWGTYSHIHHIAKKFEELGWVTKEKIGRKNKYTFTEEGNEVVQACQVFIWATKNYIELKGKKNAKKRS